MSRDVAVEEVPPFGPSLLREADNSELPAKWDGPIERPEPDRRDDNSELCLSFQEREKSGEFIAFGALRSLWFDQSTQTLVLHHEVCFDVVMSGFGTRVTQEQRDHLE